MRRRLPLAALALAGACMTVEPVAAPSSWEPLFDGASLDGWTALGDARWTVVDGVLHGRTGGGRQSFLICERPLADFVLELELRAAAAGNSGIQVRSRVDAGGRLYGYQIEVDPSERAWSGGLYEEGGRGWLQDLSGNEAARAAFRRDGWNHYRVECRGARIRSFVNGVAAADFVDPRPFLGPGRIALQVHGGQDVHVLWRNIRARSLASGG